MGFLESTLRFFINPPEERSHGGFTAFGPSVDVADDKILSLFGLNAGKVAVTEQTVLSIATAYRCVDVLSSSLASLPFDLFVKKNGGREQATGHPVYNLIKNRPHPLQTPYVWRKTLFTHALLWGDGFAKIQRGTGNRPVSLKIYHPKDVGVFISDDKERLSYTFGADSPKYGAEDVFHLKLFSTDGLRGRSVIRHAADTFSTALQSRRFTNAFYENGAYPAGIITSDKVINPDGKTRILDGWFNRTGGSNRAKTAILDEGMKYQTVGIPPGEAQLVEIMKLSREDICTLYGVPPHKAGVLDHSTNNNIEHQAIEYVQDAVTPLAVNFEQEADYKLLRVGELGQYYTKLNLNALLRGDTKSRVEYYRTMLTNAAISVNEARALEEMNPVEGGDRRYVQSGMVPTDKIDDFLDRKAKPQPTPLKPLNGKALPLNGN